MEKIRLILADDNVMVRAALRTLLQSIPEFEVIAEASDGVEALDLVAEHRPDVVLAEISLPRMSGLILTKRVSQLFPEVRVILVSMYENDEFVERGLKAGAAGYLLKDADTLDFRHTINSAFKTRTLEHSTAVSRNATAFPFN